MDDARVLKGTPPKQRGQLLATSLFGGAVLATVATASVGHAQTYFSTAHALETNTVPLSGGFVVLGGYHNQGDGGGGALRIGGTSCTPDYGLVFMDAQSTGTCYYRLDPTYSVREWGAFCDVVRVNSTVSSTTSLTAIWNPGSVSGTTTLPGTLVVPTAMMSPLPKAGQFIAISQVGGPTLWTNSSGGADPALSLSQRSILGGVQHGYEAGDLISFQSDNTSQGTFSQQGAIIVDAVNAGGTITQSHFLWGGLYDIGGLPAPSGGALIQDNPRSYCANLCGSGSSRAGGATLVPAWSGWSVLNSQTITNTGTGYSVGNMVTLSAGGGTINQGQYPELVVEGIGANGAVTAFDWVDYGSFSTLPINPTTLTAMGSGNLTFGSVAWTRGPFATTIASVGTVGTTGNTAIVLADSPPGQNAYPYGYTMVVQSFYYGDDDYAAINSALNAKPTLASSLMIPAGCGTTQPLNLSQDSSANNANPALVGADIQSSGIYAFAYPLARRHTGAPVLSRVLYGGLVNSLGNGFLPTTGSGFRDLFVEGFGIPEGYGYYGLAQGVASLHGYQGPSAAPYLIPSAGAAVEIDAASQMRIDNVHIADGGIGSGNSDFQCGLDESDPTGTISGAVASIVFTNSHMDANPAFSAGPTNPDFAMRLGASCSGSTFRNLTAYDGITADVLQHGGNAFSQIRVDSEAINATILGGAAPTINWASGTIANFGFAGAANYGVEIIGAASLSQTVCGIANTACVFTIPKVAAGALGAGQITDTQMRCGAFTHVPTGYIGVELGAGIVNTTVSGTASAGKCDVPPLQLIVMDNPSDPAALTVSLCNNSNALVAGCTGYQGPFASGQFYTQPVVSYGTVSVGANTLYAVPFYSPSSGGKIVQLGIDVTSHGTATCEAGVYGASSGLPNMLIADGGTLSVAGAGTVTTSGVLSPTVQLAPQTLYFLAVGCNGGVNLIGAVNSVGALSAPLTGAPNFTDTTTQITATWTFTAGGLPTLFGNGTITSHAGSIPNVYAVAPP